VLTLGAAVVPAFSAAIFELAWRWEQWKHFVERSVAFSSDSIHVMVGVVVQLLACAALRRPISGIWAWLVVLVLTLANETADLSLEHWPDRAMQYGESTRDVLLTLFLPTLLMLTGRWAPRLFVGGRAAAAAAATTGSENPS